MSEHLQIKPQYEEDILDHVDLQTLRKFVQAGIDDPRQKLSLEDVEDFFQKKYGVNLKDD